MFRSIAAASLLLLVGTAAIAQQPSTGAGAGEKAADPGDKIICKKFIETGSLVRGTRICKTKRDWERDRDDLRQSSVADSCRARASGGSC
jgi:hypothetical protein